MSVVALFWYCIDDTLAATLNMPGLGHIPFWIWLVVLGLSMASNFGRSAG